MHRDDPVEFCFGIGLERLANVHAGVVEQNVDRTEIAGHLGGEFPTGPDIGDIQRPMRGAAAKGNNFRRRLIGLVPIIEMTKRDIRALGRKSECGGAADAPRPAGDERDFSCEFHAGLPCCRTMLPRDRGLTKLRTMRVARTLADLRSAVADLRASHDAIALVPTMGALHDGHRALVRSAVTSGAAAVTSIFVNPLQFGAAEDLSRYPRDEAGDLATLEACGNALVWLPDPETMYPHDDATTISVTGPAENWEGAARPGHFCGVATVCAKLFGQVRPDRAYFGEKDWQQLQVVRRMVDDLHLPLSIAQVATVREPDGLALSSRNRFLSESERARAPLLYSELTETARVITDGRNADGPLHSARERLTNAGFDINYFALVDGPTLAEIPRTGPEARLIAAAGIGSVRLLDNVAA